MNKIDTFFAYPAKPKTIDLFVNTGYYFDGLNWQDENKINLNNSTHLGLGFSDNKGNVKISYKGEIKSVLHINKNNIPKYLKNYLKQHIENFKNVDDLSWTVVYCSNIIKLNEELLLPKYETTNID